jgi:hypothetical protein
MGEEMIISGYARRCWKAIFDYIYIYIYIFIHAKIESKSENTNEFNCISDFQEVRWDSACKLLKLLMVTPRKFYPSLV